MLFKENHLSNGFYLVIMEFLLQIPALRSVWYGPKDLDQRLFPFPKKICPRGHRKWSHASNCTDLVFGINYT